MKKALTGFIILLTASAAAAADREVALRYNQMLREAFDEKGQGRVIPVAIEKAVETEGSMTDDGSWTVYSSDREKGNQDIYLRSMTGIELVRMTTHAARDTAPSLSPDGRRIAFVSYREDPAGDIFTARINPSDIIEDNESGILDRLAKNISQVKTESGVIRMVKDADPVWSPDGSLIAFSSERNGDENIWICKEDGTALRQITTDGGSYPSFSHDGGALVYVSYREAASRGDIYVRDIATGKETRVTDGPAIDLFPCFAGNRNEIVFTRIDADTNADGTIDLKDASSLWSLNTASGVLYRLTLSDSSAFRARWVPAYPLTFFNSKELNFKGVLLFSEQTGGNINISMLPEYGAVPRRKRASDQYELARNYLENNRIDEQYYEHLMRVWYFNPAPVKDDQIIVVRALAETSAAGPERLRRQARAALGTMERTIPFARLMQRLNAGDADTLAEEASSLGELSPYVMESVGDHFRATGSSRRASALYKKILEAYPKYPFTAAVLLKYALTVEADFSAMFPDAFERIMTSGTISQQDSVSARIIELAAREKVLAKRISRAGELYRYYETRLTGRTEREAQGIRQILAVLNYIAGQAWLQSGDRVQARKDLDSALSATRKTVNLYYKINILLADTVRNDADVQAGYMKEALSNFVSRWNEPGAPAVAERYAGYLEKKGSQLESRGQYREAADLYRGYCQLMSYLMLRRGFDGIYGRFAPRAQVLYVEASDAAGKGSSADRTALENEYLKRLNVARMDFDRAHIYGLAYLYCRQAQAADVAVLSKDRTAVDFGYIEPFRKSLDQLEWALFMDDTFADAYLLKGWIFQYLDIKTLDSASGQDSPSAEKITKNFGDYLLERSRALYLRGIDANDERRDPASEGNLLINLGNANYQLNNFVAALDNYRAAQQYKKSFSSRKEEAFFLFHLGYAYWQTGKFQEARTELMKAEGLYARIASDPASSASVRQLMLGYYALFSRMEGDYEAAEKWYAQLLAHSARYKLKVDRARILQEMAFCREQREDFDGALNFLAQSGRAIEKLDDNEKKYYAKLKFLFIGPFVIYNFGPDNAAFGGSKIFNPLNTRQKTLLNYSLYESVSRKTGNYAAAVRYLEKKLQVAKEGDYALYRETYNTTLLNLAEAHFRLGNYDRCEQYLENSIAAFEEAGNVEGRFASLVNLSELYCHLAESGKKQAADVERVEKRIASYRENYTALRFEEKKAQAQEERKVKSRPALNDSDLHSLRLQAAEEARQVYASLDLATAILEMERAELLLADGDTEGKTGSMYAASLETVTEALTSSDLSPAARIRLMLNRALCLERTGDFARAYSEYGQMEKLAESSFSDELLIKVLMNEAAFMRRNGRRLGVGADQPMKLLARGMERIQIMPQQFAERADDIRALYLFAARIYAEAGNTSASMTVIERLAAVERVIRVHRFAPDFASPAMSGAAKAVRGLVRKYSENRRRMMSLSAEGKAEDLKAAQAEERSILARIRTAGGADARYFAVVDVPGVRSAHPVVAVYPDRDRYQVWIQSGGKISYVRVSAGELTEQLKPFTSGAYVMPVQRGLSMPEGTFSFIAARGDIPLLPERSDPKTAPVVFSGLRDSVSDVISDERGTTAAAFSLFAQDYAPARLVVTEAAGDTDLNLLADALLAARVSGAEIRAAQGKVSVGLNLSAPADESPEQSLFATKTALAGGDTVMAVSALRRYRNRVGNDSLTAAWLQSVILERRGESAAAMKLFPYNQAGSLDPAGVSFGAYLLLKNAAVNAAVDYIQANRTALTGTKDLSVYQGIVGIASEGGSRTLLDPELLNNLAARYNALYTGKFTATDGRLLNDSDRLFAGVAVKDADAEALRAMELFHAFNAETLSEEDVENIRILKPGTALLDYLMALSAAERYFRASGDADRALQMNTAIRTAAESSAAGIAGRASLRAASILIVRLRYADAVAETERVSGNRNQSLRDAAAILRAYCTVSSGNYEVKELDRIINGSTPSEIRYRAMLVKARIPRIRLINNQIEVKKGLEQYRDEILSALQFARRQRIIRSAADGIFDAISERESLEFLVSLYLRYDYSLEALRYAEIARQLEYASLYDRAVSSALPVGEFTALKERDQEKTAQMLMVNPELYFSALLPSCPLDQFRRILGKKSGALYFTAVERDLFVWTISAGEFSFRRIADGRKKYADLVRRMDDTLLTGSGAALVAEEMKTLFAPERKKLQGLNVYLIREPEMTHLESVFDRLSAYLPSVALAVAYNGRQTHPVHRILLRSENATDIAAVAQSGAPLSADGDILVFRPQPEAAAGVLAGQIRSGRAIITLMPGSGVLSERDMVLAALSGTTGIAVLDPAAREGSEAVFLSRFLTALKIKNGVRSFREARRELESSLRYADIRHLSGIYLMLITPAEERE